MMLIRKRFQIAGMECVGCTIAIEGALEDVVGVKLAEANYARQFADVEYDSELVSEQQIAATIEMVGYSLIIPENQE